MATNGSVGPHRIGEFARRVGVSPELLRAWQRRYGLLSPIRSSGGFRLYTDDDAERVARMLQALQQGLSAREAAQAALAPRPPGAGRPPGILDDAPARLLAAIENYDEGTVQTLLDESLAAFGLETVIGELIIPALAQVGSGWEKDPTAISREHFASHLIRGRLLALARLWGRGAGPLALLACVPGEEHDIPLLALGLLLRSYGWRILFLGANTPAPTLTHAIAQTSPVITVVTSFDPELLIVEGRALRRLARDGELVVGGPGATEGVCKRFGLRRLDGDVVRAARTLAGAHPRATAPTASPAR